MHLGLRPTGPNGQHHRADYLRGLRRLALLQLVLLPLLLLAPRYGSERPLEYFVLHLFTGLTLLNAVLALALLASLVSGRPGPARLLRLLAPADSQSHQDAS